MERGPSSRGLEPTSQSGLRDLVQVQQSRGGSVCCMQKCTVCSLVCLDHTGQSFAGNGCIGTSAVAQDALIHLPSTPAHPSVPGPSAGKAAASDPDSPEVHRCVMVSMPAAADIRLAMETPVVWECSLPDRGSNQELPNDREVFVSLATERKYVVRTIQGVRAASNRASYTVKWTAF